MNYPDIKYLLTSDNSRRIPVMIEVKGKKRDLIKVNEKGEIDDLKKNSDSNVLTDGADGKQGGKQGGKVFSIQLFSFKKLLFRYDGLDLRGFNVLQLENLTLDNFKKR